MGDDSVNENVTDMGEVKEIEDEDQDFMMMVI
jgi:hypothetical protein